MVNGATADGSHPVGRFDRRLPVVLEGAIGRSLGNAGTHTDRIVA
jgi:hypothetical protein